MKKTVIGALAILLIASSCKKEKITPEPTPVDYTSEFKSKFVGEWKRVASKDVSGVWESDNTVMLVTDQMIGYPYNRPYQVYDADEVTLTDTNEKLHVNFGKDTTVLTFANGSQAKIVVY